MMLPSKLCALLALAAMAVSGATDDEFFETRVRPVLATRCYACHTNSKLGGLRLDSRSALLQGGASGPAIVPGKAADSLLIKAINYSEERIKMPLGGAKLNDQEIADLSRWVDMGAPWPESKNAPPSAKQGFTITPEARNFWSFQPLRKPAIPSAAGQGWAKGTIDKFVAAKLEEKRLERLKPAGKRVLLRRA